MKHNFLILFLSFLICFNSCSLRYDIPKEGIWYCDELKTSIDFSEIEENNNCVKYYYTDTEFEMRKCLIDYGNGISIVSCDQSIEYLIGNFMYDNDIFVITDNEKEYTFYKVN